MGAASADKFCLGTAQFGLDYGIANKSGRPAREAVFEILRYASAGGIKTLDTAYSYGDSEETIGEFLASEDAPFAVISKMPDIAGEGPAAVSRYCGMTLKRLARKALYGYLAHNFGNIESFGRGLWDELLLLKKNRLVKKIGVSLYRTEELDFLLSAGMTPDLAQLPYSILDRRFERHLPVLKEKGVEIHARSIFLQGLVFLGDDRIGRDFCAASKTIDELRGISAAEGIPLSAMSICFCLLNRSIDKLVFGVESVPQLKENLESLKYLDRVKAIQDSLDALKLDDENILVPTNWKR